jgi:serine/threonine protein kinase
VSSHDAILHDPNDVTSEGAGAPRFRGPSELRLQGQEIAGRFRIRTKIAEGAAGSIYEAVQMPIGRRVAIKVLNVQDDHESADRIRKRFHREASIAARLAHPNIVSIYDFGETEDGNLFTVMEYVEGRSLFEVAREVGRFSRRRALNIAIQLVRALRKAHEQGVVHRDLKPANIMVQPDDDDLDFVKVLDFGIVKIFSEDEGDLAGVHVDENLTNAGVLLGTPGYMAPEQAIGEQVDGRADLYSVGVILYQLLTGRPPFEADSIVDLIRAQVMEEPKFLRDADPDADCSAELEALVHRCIDRSRDARPATARELLAQLKTIWRAETDDSYGTETSLAPYELGNFNTHPSVTPIPDGVPLEDPSVVGAIPGSTVKLDAMEPPRVPTWIWVAAIGLFILGGLGTGVWLGMRGDDSVQIPVQATKTVLPPEDALPEGDAPPEAPVERRVIEPIAIDPPLVKPPPLSKKKPAKSKKKSDAEGYLDNPY